MLIFLKALMVVGMVLNVFLVLSKNAKIKATPEGQELWAFGKKNIAWNIMIGVVANFFDTLGIGSYATSSFLIKIKSSVKDIHIPGTLNVGDTFPVCLEAFLFFGIVDVDYLTLITMIAAATLGAFFGAGIVTKWNQHMVRIGMGVGLLILGIIMLLRSLEVGPFGITGTALKLTGVKLVVGIVINFFLGALMNVAVGLYAPCLALVAVLGMNVAAAFPIMMGSCACLMAFGNGPKFVKEGKYDMVATMCQMFAGAVGVLLAYFIVKSLPLKVLTWVVVCVVFLTSFLFFKDAIKGKKDD